MVSSASSARTAPTLRRPRSFCRAAIRFIDLDDAACVGAGGGAIGDLPRRMKGCQVGLAIASAGRLVSSKKYRPAGMRSSLRGTVGRIHGPFAPLRTPLGVDRVGADDRGPCCVLHLDLGAGRVQANDEEPAAGRRWLKVRYQWIISSGGAGSRVDLKRRRVPFSANWSDLLIPRDRHGEADEVTGDDRKEAAGALELVGEYV